ncbi:MAG TPA: flagellar hook-associated protein FlgK [Chthonomonadaceae bacterium]|nr:flagellar hook-associated protein FlgK [Chthonomonadaceae bacterium]
MGSTFGGLEIGSRALTASQLALDVIGQNTANVGTAGYSRQVVNLEETDPYGGPGVDTLKPAQLGTGVSVASVTRVRDNYLDKQTFSATSDQSAANSLQQTIGRVESAYGEPSTTGISSQLTAFFNSFSDLSATPDSAAIRSTVLNQGQALVSAFHTVSGALAQIAPDIQSQVKADIGKINDLAGQIAGLNKQIGASLAEGEQPNDLEDKRTGLIGQLSGLVGVQVLDGKNSQTNQPSGQVEINVGGYLLVQDGVASALPATVATQGGQPAVQTASGLTIPLQGGEVSGLLQASRLLSGYQSDLDTLANTVVTTVNGVHSAGAGLDGVTGRAFFSGTGAAGIAISSDVASNPNAIAAASAPPAGGIVAPGNGDVARALAALGTQLAIGQSTLNQYYAAKVAGVGADAQRFQTEADTQGKIVAQLQNQQSSVSGVNLDEELTKLLQFQRTYQAAARIINAQDSVLDLIINGIGGTAATTAG